MQRAVGTLIAASLLAAWMSEILVGAAEGTGKSLDVADLYRNRIPRDCGRRSRERLGDRDGAQEQAGFERRHRAGQFHPDRALCCSRVGAGKLLHRAQPLDLAFRRAEVGSLFLGVLLGTIVCGDGQSNWYKGVQLITVYSIIALMFFVIPELGP